MNIKLTQEVLNAEVVRLWRAYRPATIVGPLFQVSDHNIVVGSKTARLDASDLFMTLDDFTTQFLDPLIRAHMLPYELEVFDRRAPQSARYGLGCPDCGILTTGIHRTSCPRTKNTIKVWWYCALCDFSVVTITTEANAHVKEACAGRVQDLQGEISCRLTNKLKQSPETVDHPAHYGGADSQYEVIKVLEAWLTPEEFRGFLKGNVIKYNARARLKNGDEDYAKALWYAAALDNYNMRIRERAERRVPRDA